MRNIIWVFRLFGFGAGVLYTMDVISRPFKKPWHRRAEDRAKAQPSSIEAWLSQEDEQLADHEVEEIQVHNFNTLN